MLNNIDNTQPENFLDVTSQYSDLFEGKQKKINCPYELVFNITAYLMKENENGEDMSAEQISGKNFHIPVKDGADPKLFMNTFFEFLENCLSKSAKHAYEQEPKNEPNV